jgi:hypothetical protein
VRFEFCTKRRIGEASAATAARGAQGEAIYRPRKIRFSAPFRHGRKDARAKFHVLLM